MSLLEDSHFGRIACAQNLQPYVIPFSFVYYESFIYSFGTVGRMIEWMRSNPLICVEIEKIVSRQEWQTVVIFGRYQELPETPEFHDIRVLAHHLLSQFKLWWEPGYVKTLDHEVERPLQPVYFRTPVTEISGHQGIRDPPVV